MDFLQKIKTEAKKLSKRIVFPESSDARVLKAASILAKKRLVYPILLGEQKKITALAKKNRIKLEGVTILCPDEKYTDLFVKARKHKGVTRDEAKMILRKPTYYGVMMVYSGDADGLVSGSLSPTADTLRPAFQLLKSGTIASSHMIIIHEKKVFLFADCAVIIRPDEEQLAQIAISTVKSARFYGIKPKVAMLSFSTKGSAEHEDAKLVADATAIARKKLPEVVIDGEMQADAALVPEVAKIKDPELKIKGDANILIFPNLSAGNIGYKLVQRFSGATAIGPITQGLSKPVNDLSRGCSVNDIVLVAAITAVQTKHKIK